MLVLVLPLLLLLHLLLLCCLGLLLPRRSAAPKVHMRTPLGAISCRS